LKSEIASRLPMADIIQYMEEAPAPLAEIALKLRKLVLTAAPHATESIHWRALSYHDAARGGMVKGAICQLAVREDHVLLAFIHGVRLPDPSGLLEGDRLSKRYVRIKVMNKSMERALTKLVRAAADFVAGG